MVDKGLCSVGDVASSKQRFSRSVVTPNCPSSALARECVEEFIRVRQSLLEDRGNEVAVQLQEVVSAETASYISNIRRRGYSWGNPS